ncbi:MAG: hypothetical protein ACI8XZ_002725, partial [Gammaproteobacteria bacterium]
SETGNPLATYISIRQTTRQKSRQIRRRNFNLQATTTLKSAGGKGA